MRGIVFLFLSILVPILASADCQLQKQKDGQRYFTCRTPHSPKAVHVLDLRGGFAETAYYHGLFLRNQIEVGVLPTVHEKAERAFSKLKPQEREQVELIKKCVLDNYRVSVSEEFKSGLRKQYKGYRDAGGVVGWKQFEEANYLVEFSIYADAMRRLLAQDPRGEKRKIFSTCAPYFIGRSLLAPFKLLAEGLRSLKMGCTGISTSASYSSDGALVHGRNFDTGLLGALEKDQVIVINRQRNGITSVGVAAAGLHYAGGISGFNNYGLAVSLHELQTEETQVRYAPGTSDIAPYLLHRVLMNARTLDEAIRLIKQRKGFGAWTFFMSDSKTDEAVSVEMSGDTVAVARRKKNSYMGQSNHFIAPATLAEGYEYSLNKTLETRARLSHVQRTAQEDRGSINAQWVINRLSGHHDELIGPRAFGRTTTKVYTAATHVLVPGRQEWWMSLGTTYPTHRSGFIGLRLQTAESYFPVRVIGFKKATEDPQKNLWYDSMKYYVQSYLSHEKDSASSAGVQKTLNFLELAKKKAAETGIFEFPYEFMSARLKVYYAALLISTGQREHAYQALLEAEDSFQEIAWRLKDSLHPYEKVQLELWRFRAEHLKPQNRQNKNILSERKRAVLKGLNRLISQHPTQRELGDLKTSLLAPTQLPVVLEAEVRLGTVE